MPRYDFQCRLCSHTFETELSFGSDEAPACPKCKGDTDRLIAPPAIHFKGEGFYNSDNRKKEKTVPDEDVGARRVVPKSDEGTKETKNDTAAATQESQPAPKAQKDDQKQP